MADAQELRDLTRRLYAAMSSGDADAVEAFYSLGDDVCFIGTSASEFWTDPAQHNADVRHFFDGSSGRARFEAGEMKTAFAADGGGWVVDTPTVHLPDGTSVATRLTVIWRREPGGWRVVHTHISVGAG